MRIVNVLWIGLYGYWLSDEEIDALVAMGVPLSNLDEPRTYVWVGLAE